MHFLEIWYAITKCFTPQQICNPEKAEKEATEDLFAKEKARKRQQAFTQSLRHGKFGT